jgi:putative transposase
VIITDHLKSYGAALRELLPSVGQRQHRYPNNRAERSHQPTRQRERRMGRFESAGRANASSRPMAPAYRQQMAQQFRPWRQITGTAWAA